MPRSRRPSEKPRKRHEHLRLTHDEHHRPVRPRVVPRGTPGNVDGHGGDLRIRREFTDWQKDEFGHEAFENIARHFEQSLNRLEQKHAGTVKCTFRQIDETSFEATAYVDGQERSRCGVWVGGGGAFSEERRVGLQLQRSRKQEQLQRSPAHRGRRIPTLPQTGDGISLVARQRGEASVDAGRGRGTSVEDVHAAHGVSGTMTHGELGEINWSRQFKASNPGDTER